MEIRSLALRGRSGIVLKHKFNAIAPLAFKLGGDSGVIFFQIQPLDNERDMKYNNGGYITDVIQ